MTVAVVVDNESPDPGASIDVIVTGLVPSTPTACLLDGIGYRTARFDSEADGSAEVWRVVAGSPKAQTLQMAQYISGSWSDAGDPIAIHVGGVTVTPPADPATVPDPPISVAVVAGDTVADASWNAPVQDGGDAITGYQPYLDDIASGSPVAGTTKHLTALVNGVAKTFKVAAINGVGTSVKSAGVLFTPVAAAISDWSGKPAYLSYSSSAPIVLSGQTGFIINAKKFVSQTGNGVVSIRLTGCSDFIIEDIDYDGDTEPIFLDNCTDFEVRFNRSRNIIGPHQRDGSHRANFIQMQRCFRYWIHHNKILGGDCEDVISNYLSGGSDASNYSRITDNEIDLLHNTQWSSGSGTGIILGDGGIGSYVEVARNKLLSPAQVGIQIIDGVGHLVHNNTLYSAPRPGLVSPNVGMSSYSGSPTAEVFSNTVYWRKNDGNQNPFWWGAGSINDHDNAWHATTLDPATLAVTL